MPLQGGRRPAAQGRLGFAAVARELGISKQTLRNWVKAEASGKLNAACLSTTGRCEAAGAEMAFVKLGAMRAGLPAGALTPGVIVERTRQSSQPSIDAFDGRADRPSV